MDPPKRVSALAIFNGVDAEYTQSFKTFVCEIKGKRAVVFIIPVILDQVFGKQATDDAFGAVYSPAAIIGESGCVEPAAVVVF